MVSSTHRLKTNKNKSQPRLDAKRIFKQEIVEFWQNAVLNTNWCKTEFATTKVIIREGFMQLAFL